MGREAPRAEPLWSLSRRRMVLKSCVWIVVSWMRLPSRISIRCLELMIYSINSEVCVCSLILIFDQDIISWRFESVIYQRLHLFWVMVYISTRWCHLDWLMHQPILCIWWIRFSWSIWTSLSWCSSMIYWSTQEVKKNMKSIFIWFCRSFEIISYMLSWVNVNFFTNWVNVSFGWSKLPSYVISSWREEYL
jgi:hypothetical protein